MSYKHLYKHFIGAHPERLHFAAHSHHPWPDVTREAQLRAWDDAAQLVDHKWDHIFSHVIPTAQAHIARILKLPQPEQICFAPNTHEFVCRILSCYEPHKKIRVLTTDSEFHSFTRQINRFEESGQAQVTRVAVEPFETFEMRFVQALTPGGFDLVFLSHVFFLQGFAVANLTKLLCSVPHATTIVVDGYHSFGALPVDLSGLANRIFYLGGGYKYAQSGEGCCFLAVPPGCQLRPSNTGWFASFESLDKPHTTREPTAYSDGGYRFWGATFDPTGLYRFNAVQQLFEQNQLTVNKMHEIVTQLQRHFVTQLTLHPNAPISKSNLLMHDRDWHGHFLSFRTPQAREIASRLFERGVIVDARGDVLRFGFGIYQDTADIDLVFKRL